MNPAITIDNVTYELLSENSNRPVLSFAIVGQGMALTETVSSLGSSLSISATKNCNYSNNEIAKRSNILHNQRKFCY